VQHFTVERSGASHEGKCGIDAFTVSKLESASVLVSAVPHGTLDRKIVPCYLINSANIIE